MAYADSHICRLSSLLFLLQEINKRHLAGCLSFALRKVRKLLSWHGGGTPLAQEQATHVQSIWYPFCPQLSTPHFWSGSPAVEREGLGQRLIACPTLDGLTRRGT